MTECCCDGQAGGLVILLAAFMNQNLELHVQDPREDQGGGCRHVCTPPPPRDEAFFFVFVYLTIQLRHSLVVDFLLRKILDPSLMTQLGFKCFW